jgi:hypothetical protein
VQAGAIFVDAAAGSYLRSSLTGAGVHDDDVDEYSKAGIKDFESHAKRAFSNEAKDYSIAIARSRFNVSSIRIHRGHMKLPG